MLSRLDTVMGLSVEHYIADLFVLGWPIQDNYRNGKHVSLRSLDFAWQWQSSVSNSLEIQLYGV